MQFTIIVYELKMVQICQLISVQIASRLNSCQFHPEDLQVIQSIQKQINFNIFHLIS